MQAALLAEVLNLTLDWPEDPPSSGSCPAEPEQCDTGAQSQCGAEGAETSTAAEDVDSAGKASATGVDEAPMVFPSHDEL